MQDIVQSFLRLQLHFRVSILLGIALLLWWIFGGRVLWVLSLIPYLLKKIFTLIYLLFDAIFGGLHKIFGRAFAWLDNGFTSFSEKIINRTDAAYKRLHKPKGAFRGWAFLIVALLIAYVMLPYYSGWSGDMFTFWQPGYSDWERNAVLWMNRRGWISIVYGR